MTQSTPPASPFRPLARLRAVPVSVRWLLAGYAAALGVVAWLAPRGVPFDRPAIADVPLLPQTVIMLLLPVVFIGVTHVLTRHRTVDLAALAPDRATALRETVALLLYGAFALGFGQVLGTLLTGHGIGLHLHGSVWGASTALAPAEVLLWVGYNLTAFGIVPYLLFRRRGYGHGELALRSTDRRNDAVVIGTVLAIGVAFDLLFGGLAGLSGRQFALGAPLTLLVHLLGTALPVMIFLYAILLPRFARLTGSVAAATILAGFGYAGLHVFEGWTLYDSAGNAALSLLFVFLQFVGPGMVKGYLTLRTGNAWVHVWAYHVVSVHVTVDTPNIVRFFGIR